MVQVVADVKNRFSEKSFFVQILCELAVVVFRFVWTLILWIVSFTIGVMWKLFFPMRSTS